MGMICYYFKTDGENVQKMRNGNASGVLFQREEEENALCIDKAWHAIHFVLTGNKFGGEEENFLENLVFGGLPINEEDLGYGPARLIGKETVEQLAEALACWDKSAFREHFHMKSLMENDIYPVMENEDEDGFFTYIWENFAALKDFIQQAAREGLYVLTYIA